MSACGTGSEDRRGRGGDTRAATLEGLARVCHRSGPKGKGRRPSLSHSPTRHFGARTKRCGPAAALEVMRIVTDKLNDDLSPAENAARLLEVMLEDGNDAGESGLNHGFPLQTLNSMQRATLMYAARVLRSDVQLSAIPQGLQPASLKGTMSMQATVVTASGRRRSSMVDNVFARHLTDEAESAASVVNDWLRGEYTPLGASLVVSADRPEGPSSSIMTTVYAADTADAPSGAPAEISAESRSLGHGPRGDNDEEDADGAESAGSPEVDTKPISYPSCPRAPVPSIKPESSSLANPWDDESLTMLGLQTANFHKILAADVTCFEATASEWAAISEALKHVDQWDWSVVALHEASAQHGLQVLSFAPISLSPSPSLPLSVFLSRSLSFSTLSLLLRLHTRATLPVSPQSRRKVPVFIREHV